MNPLNPASTAPLYAQLAELLSRKIRAGEYEPGEKIPSENALAKDYSIGRPTVRQATELLIRRGYVERRKGSGTFVRAREGTVDLFSLGGTLSSFDSQGIKLVTSLVESPSLVSEAEAGHVFFDRPSFRLQRLGKVEERPVLLETFWFDAETFPHLDCLDLSGRSLSGIVLDEFGVEATGAEQEFRVAHLDSWRAGLFQLETGSAVLEVARKLHFQNAISAVFALMHCLTSGFSFSQKLGTAAQLPQSVGVVR